jgi:hypothetical protein
VARSSAYRSLSVVAARQRGVQCERSRMANGPVAVAVVLIGLLLHGCVTGDRPGPSSVEVARDEADGTRTHLVRTWDDGGGTRRLTPAFHSAWDPDVSPDARFVLFAGKRKADGPEGIHELELATGHLRPILEKEGRLRAPRYAAGGNVVFLWNTTGGGVDRRAGVLHGLAPGAKAKPQRITFHRRLDLAPNVATDGRVIFGVDGQNGLLAVNWDGTEVGSFSEPTGPHGKRAAVPLEPVTWLENGAFLMARSQEEEKFFRIPARNRYYQLFSANPGDGPPSNVPVVARPEPFLQPTIVEPERPVGEIFCFDARKGVGMPPIPTEPREWPHVRIYVFTPASATSLDGKEELAARDVSLLPDGSFSAWVPADRGLRFELVSRGRVLRTMNRTVWLRPGEKRGCIGCHERHGVAPPNRVPLALDAPPVKVMLP